MHIIDLLEQIRPRCILKVSKILAPGEGIRDSFRDQLNRFYDLLQQALVSGNPEWLAPLLYEWANVRTETDLENQDPTVSPLLNQIFMLTWEVAKDELSPEQAVEFFSAIMPIYSYTLEHTLKKETQQFIVRFTHKLEESQAQLERLDKSKSDFIAVAAHELKTPLTLIEGYASMLWEVLTSEQRSSHPATFLMGINNGTRRLREIVDDLIDISIIDNNMLSLNLQPVWLGQLLNIVCDELSPGAAARNQKLELRYFPGSDEMTFMDSERLCQAFRNVISNGIKYTPDGGKITIDGRKLPGFAEIIISDNGIGINPEDQARIFEQFSRVGDVSLHSSGKIKFKGGGPGLGLSITKGIIEAHGGSIWVESPGYDEVNCPGSTFHLLLPLHKEPPNEKLANLYQPLIKLNRTQLIYYTEETEQAP